MSVNEGFLSRWSRRKHDSRNADDEAASPATDEAASPATDDATSTKQPPADGSVPTTTDGAPAGSSPSDASSNASPAALGKADPSADDEAIELPSIDSLTPQSDFRPFMKAGVDATTRNAALAQLFRDPHFNVMDGLDVYIDDYNKTEPIPPALLAKLKQLHGIGLSDDEIERWSDDAERPIADADAAQPVAQQAAGDDAMKPSAQTSASDDPSASDDAATTQNEASEADAAPGDPMPAEPVRLAQADPENTSEGRADAPIEEKAKSQERAR